MGFFLGFSLISDPFQMVFFCIFFIEQMKLAQLHHLSEELQEVKKQAQAEIKTAETQDE